MKIAKEREIPIRVGVNGGSLEADLLQTYGHTAKALSMSALRNVRYLEELGFEDIVVSIKASQVRRCVESYELFAKECTYPLHIGITEAGTIEDGSIKSALGLGILLYEGLGDTLRVSLTGDPVEEVHVAQKVLHFMGLRQFGIEFVSCPTCGRTNIDLIALANQAQKALAGIKSRLRWRSWDALSMGRARPKKPIWELQAAREKDCCLEREKFCVKCRRISFFLHW